MRGASPQKGPVSRRIESPIGHLGLWLVALPLAGCTSFEEVRACQAAIETMNPLLAEIQASGAGATEDATPTFIRLQASRYRKMSGLLSELPQGPATTERPLASLRAEFRKVADILDEAAQGKQDERVDRYLAAKRRLDGERTRVEELKRQLARRCGG